jgi:2-polyprenyl-3-methyl-5-hydroxy-6-metoxy-1,4-benzoquinol methylase
VTERRDHYSYSVYAEPSTARRFDHIRFGGPVGQLVGAREAEAIARLAGPIAARTVLDVGTGTGRIALFLARAGASVTGLDASEEMLKVARERAMAEHAEVQFVAGDAHALNFPDQSFDVVVSSRMLMHAPRWHVCVDEMCRVARTKVVIDYPSARSLALFQSLYRRANYALGGATTQPYRVFLDHELKSAFEKDGFQLQSKDRHFVLPVSLYKLFGSARGAQLSEQVLRRVGLSRMFASPVTVLAERRADIVR